MEGKIVKKSIKHRSLRALGRSWGPRGPVEAQNGFHAFPLRNINRSWSGLGGVLGPSWARLVQSGAVFGVLLCNFSRSWALLGAFKFGSTSVAKGLLDAFLMHVLSFFIIFFWFSISLTATPKESVQLCKANKYFDFDV